MEKRLYRSTSDEMIGGVCAGLGEYFDVDPTLVRLVFIVLLFGGVGFLLYLAMWIVVPERPFAGAAQQSPIQTQSGPPQGGTYQGTQAGQPGPAGGQASSQPSQVLGAVLVAIGVLMLLNIFNIRVWRWVDPGVLWPSVLIAFGVWLLLNRQGGQRDA